MTIPGTVGHALRARDRCDGRGHSAGRGGRDRDEGPNLCAGYWRRAETTAESFYPNGFFRTGDTGFLDATGRLTIASPLKDLIISRGFNLYPAEIEMLLAEVPGVQDVAVDGVPHPDFAEAVTAAVTTHSSGFDRAAMEALIDERLARYKQPRPVHVLEEFPRNAMGKILKQDLSDRYRAALPPDCPSQRSGAASLGGLSLAGAIMPTEPFAHAPRQLSSS